MGAGYMGKCSWPIAELSCRRPAVCVIAVLGYGSFSVENFATARSVSVKLEMQSSILG